MNTDLQQQKIQSILDTLIVIMPKIYLNNYINKDIIS